MRLAIAAACCLVASGCATNLVLHEADAAASWTGGIPVNKRAAFQSTVKIASNVNLGCKHPCELQRLDGVDPAKLLSVDIRRQAFASGKVSIDLDELQRLKQVKISSDSGAANGLETASKVIGAVAPKPATGK